MAPDERLVKADRQARITINLLVKYDQLHHIRNTNSTKDAWTALRNYHQKASLTKVFLLKKFCSMKLPENGHEKSFKRNAQHSGSVSYIRRSAQRQNDYSLVIL